LHQKDQELIKKLEAKISMNLKEIGMNKIEQKVVKLKVCAYITSGKTALLT